MNFKKKKKIEFQKKKKNIFYIKNFGSISYLSMLYNVNGIIGNSSSGILEMPIIKNFTINIGDRQKGRGKSDFIYDVVPNFKKIQKLIIKICKKKKVNKNLNLKKKPTILEITSVLKKNYNKNLIYKKFFDI